MESAMKHTTKLRELVNDEAILLTPGTYDPLMAKLIAQAGFKAIEMNGAGVTYSTLAMPDLGLVTMTEMVERARRVADASDLPVICDADTGYGNALNVIRTVREFERAGVAAIRIEDQEMPKRCGHFLGKTLVSTEEMVGKVKAALDTRTDPDFLIIARTDARTVDGFEAALDRVRAYAEAGADVVFVESPRTVDELAAIPKAVDVPVLANMIEGGLSPLLSAAELERLGYSVVLFANGLARYLTRQAQDFLDVLKREGTTEPLIDRMNSFTRQNELLGLQEFEELARKYGG
jgi:2-methylisocitrate lyase-like PEP mutase family enzyme